MDNNNIPLVKPGDVLLQFGLDPAAVSVIPVQQGLINDTWKIQAANKAYILQRINHAVFKKPEDADHNISSISAFLEKNHPGYIFTSPLKTTAGATLYRDSAENYYRLFSFIEGSHTRSTVETAQQAYEAARQFGKFTATLKDFEARSLKDTLPSFHDLAARYRQFLQALKNGNATRIAAAGQLISRLKDYASIVDHFEKMKTDPQFRRRVTHHDTKISKVLFDTNDRGICVIDLDTVMPGYFISDVGDMMRTYLCPVTEEEQDAGTISIRPEMYDAIVNGYLDEMKDELTEQERQHFFYAGSFMIYMQALRFLTDHINNDRYYGAAYEGHNYNRANNQLVLLQHFMNFKMDRRTRIVPPY